MRWYLCCFSSKEDVYEHYQESDVSSQASTINAVIMNFISNDY